MTAKSFKGPLALLVFCLSISLWASAASAQYDSQMGPEPSQQKPPAEKAKPTGPPINKPEEDAYKAFFAARTASPATQVQLGEDFIVKFPQSHYLMAVYSTLTTAYLNLGQEDKMFAAGAKAIELNPDNVDILSLLSMTIPRRMHANSPDSGAQLQKAEGYAHHVIELIPNLTKPAELDDASFEKLKNDKLSMAHSGLGLIDIDHSKYEDARNELTLAVQLASTPDPVDYYLLGNADSQASYYNDAVTAYGKCATTGPLMAQCSARVETAKKDAANKLGR